MGSARQDSSYGDFLKRKQEQLKNDPKRTQESFGQACKRSAAWASNFFNRADRAPERSTSTRSPGPSGATLMPSGKSGIRPGRTDSGKKNRRPQKKTVPGAIGSGTGNSSLPLYSARPSSR